MPEITYGGAVLAGLLSFFSPCILPMVPFYLSYMAGSSVQELQADGGIAPGARQRLILRAAAFALGVTTIFVLLGLGATTLGRAFVQWKEPLTWLAAGVLLLFGLHFLGVLRIGVFYREARVRSEASPASMIGAYVMGLAFGFGWTPCVGPALAAILMVAAGMGSLWQGGLLLLVYGLSMTLPFVLAAGFAGPFLGWVARHRALTARVEKVMGVMLVIFAVLLVTGSVNQIGEWMVRSFDWSLTLR